LPVTRGSTQELRRKVATVLLARARLEAGTYHQAAAEPIARRELDMLDDSAPEPATRMLRAMVERTLSDIQTKQGHAAEALRLMESARQTLLDLQSSGHQDPNLRSEATTAQDRLARARVFVGDLDGALHEFQEMLRTGEPCPEQGPPGPECRTLGYRLERTADIYAATDRPNLNEPAKAAELYTRALRLQERLIATDANDRQALFDLAARCGKLGDAVWAQDPKRALALYDRALATAKELVSKEQFGMFRSAYLFAITRPLIQLGRTTDARRALTEVLEQEKTNAGSSYADRVGEISARAMLPKLLLAEGKRADARRELETLIRDCEALRVEHSGDLVLIYYLSRLYRALAAIISSPERRQALLRSAAAWHSWPATSFTRREEQKDLAAAGR
jgi:hypothetical protein